MSQTRMEFAYTQLREKVWAGDLKPGDRLVNRTLGTELGVSTVTVREAIHRLASDGVVEHVPNAGAYVRKLTVKEMVDLFSFRAWIDLFTAIEAARKIQPHELNRLRAINTQMRDIVVALRNVPQRVLDGELMERWLEIDRRFHRLLGEAAHNSWIIKATGDIHMLSHVMRAKAPYCSFSDAAWTYRQHAEITRALEKKNIERVSQWMRIHGNQALATMLNSFGDAGEHEIGLSAFGDGSIGAGISRERLVKRARKEKEERAQ